ncbi:MAG TPA: hypothetical protein VFF65_09555 [Phycisphaerales bacterium]|nr:hypothetical protein [Phycisphaerales bacterium]
MAHQVVFRRCFGHDTSASAPVVPEMFKAMLQPVRLIGEGRNDDGSPRTWSQTRAHYEAQLSQLRPGDGEVCINREEGKCGHLLGSKADTEAFEAFLWWAHRAFPALRFGCYGVRVKRQDVGREYIEDRLVGGDVVKGVATLEAEDAMRADCLRRRLDVLDIDGYLRLPGGPVPDGEPAVDAWVRAWRSATLVELLLARARWGNPLRLWISPQCVGGATGAERAPGWAFGLVLAACADFCRGGLIESAVILLGSDGRDRKLRWVPADGAVVESAAQLMRG